MYYVLIGFQEKYLLFKIIAGDLFCVPVSFIRKKFIRK